ncbi:hypothetical protein AMECASPLE_023932 [Ameca splendens]|uniref:Uncharacterized protein n=1 Tax=Ameca splendens TaxID=208324 RepID=A0ABV0XH75_9TELE
MDNRGGENCPLRLYVTSIPWNLVKALPEVGAEYILGRGLQQTFPADPHYTLGPAKSVWLPHLPVGPTDHQVVIGGQLSLTSPKCPNHAANNRKFNQHSPENPLNLLKTSMNIQNFQSMLYIILEPSLQLI